MWNEIVTQQLHQLGASESTRTAAPPRGRIGMALHELLLLPMSDLPGDAAAAGLLKTSPGAVKLGENFSHATRSMKIYVRIQTTDRLDRP